MERRIAIPLAIALGAILYIAFILLDISTPQPAGASDIPVSNSFGLGHTCVAQPDTAVQCWSLNGSGLPESADVNADGEIASVDPALIPQYTPGLIHSL